MNDAIASPITLAARLRVRGPDAAVFLQGQFTNNLRQPGVNACTYGLWLNQKGRALADSYVLARGTDAFEIVSLASPAAGISERLEAYIIADDVDVTDGTPGSRGWIVTAGVLDALGLEPPEVGRFIDAAGAGVFRAREMDQPNWCVAVPPEAVPTWESNITALAESRSLELVDSKVLAPRRVAAGLATIPSEIGPGDLPNEGGLEHEAISFTKGCYLGQEVMARLKNLGQVRRRLYVVRLPSGAVTPASRTELFVGDRRVGDLRSLFEREGGDALGLAMLHTAHVSIGQGLATAPGTAATLEIVRLAEGRAW